MPHNWPKHYQDSFNRMMRKDEAEARRQLSPAEWKKDGPAIMQAIATMNEAALSEIYSLKESGTKDVARFFMDEGVMSPDRAADWASGVMAEDGAKGNWDQSMQRAMTALDRLFSQVGVTNAAEAV